MADLGAWQAARGEVWRLVTFLFIPPDWDPFFFLMFVYFTWWVASNLETHWGAFRFDVGTVAIPSAPGLGVQLDEDRVATYHEAFDRGVVRHRDDTAELVKRAPGWLPIKPRW